MRQAKATMRLSQSITGQLVIGQEVRQDLQFNQKQATGKIPLGIQSGRQWRKMGRLWETPPPPRIFMSHLIHG